MYRRPPPLDHDPAETGGWFCYGRCQAWTALDLDKEQPTCAYCGRATVKHLPPAKQFNRPRPEPPAVTVERGRELFALLKSSLNQ